MTEKGACKEAQSAIKDYYKGVGYAAAKIPKFSQAQKHAKNCTVCKEVLDNEKKKGYR